MFLVTVLFIFGGATLKDFAFAMMVGVASGAYSSIFIATPVLTALEGARARLSRPPRRGSIEEMGDLPAFPEENVVARLGDDERAGAGGRPHPQRRAQARAPTADRSPPKPERRAEPAEAEPGAAPSSDGAAEPARAEPLTAGAEARAQSRPPRAERAAKRRQQRRRAKAREASLMAAARLVHGRDRALALHGFVPDRFWAGIVGALLGAVTGAMLSGAIVQIATGRTIGDTDLGTAARRDPGHPDRACGDLRDRRARKDAA